MPNSTSSDSSSEDENWAAFASAAVTVESLESDSRAIAQRAQARKQSQPSFGARMQPRRSAPASHTGDAEAGGHVAAGGSSDALGLSQEGTRSAREDQTSMELGPVELKIAAALDKRLERIQSSWWATTSASTPTIAPAVALAAVVAADAHASIGQALAGSQPKKLSKKGRAVADAAAASAAKGAAEEDDAAVCVHAAANNAASMALSEPASKAASHMAVSDGIATVSREGVTPEQLLADKKKRKKMRQRAKRKAKRAAEGGDGATACSSSSDSDGSSYGGGAAQSKAVAGALPTAAGQTKQVAAVNKPAESALKKAAANNGGVVTAAVVRDDSGFIFFSQVPRGTPCILERPAPPPGLKYTHAWRAVKEQASRQQVQAKTAALSDLAVDGQALLESAPPLLRPRKKGEKVRKLQLPATGVMVEGKRPFVPHEARMAALLGHQFPVCAV